VGQRTFKEYLGEQKIYPSREPNRDPLSCSLHCNLCTECADRPFRQKLKIIDLKFKIGSIASIHLTLAALLVFNKFPVTGI
jgi:hypothetical protein